MLQVNLDDSDEEVERSIRERCAEIGVVQWVTFHRLPTPFAVIEMFSSEEVHELADRLGGSAFGTATLVHLEQQANVNTSPEQLWVECEA